MNAVHNVYDLAGGEPVIGALYDFVMGLRFADAPTVVRERTRLLALDLLGVLAAGTDTELSRIVSDFVVDQYGPGRAKARLPFDGRPVSPSGAALATGMTIDAIDAHDGHRLTKGHVGCGSLAALLALAEDLEVTDGTEILTALLIAYEIGSRAGRVLHEAPETAAQYHSSGAWVTLACVALGTRLMGLDRETFRHALAIAEYHGPRSPIMKVVNNPSMLKDGSGWGAMAGVAALYLARSGFTGAPVILMESAHLRHYWSDLGENWEVLQQYVKPQPVCRWAQPPIAAAESLLREHAISSTDIAGVTVETFEEATLLSQDPPGTTEDAQYNVTFPLAALLVRGTVGVAEVVDEKIFDDPEVLRLTNLIEMRREPSFDAVFPQERWAKVTLKLVSGAVLESAPAVAQGDPETMLSTDEFRAKFHAYSARRWSADQRAQVVDHVARLDADPAAWPALRNLLYP